MLRPLSFAVGTAPVSAADVEQSRALAARLVSVNRWLWLPAFPLVIYLGWIAGHRLFAYLEAVQPEVAFNAFPATAFGLFVAGALAGCFGAWVSHWRDQAERLAPIDGANAESALALVAQHKELDAWRRAIVQQREIVNAELDEMRRFHCRAEERERVAAIQARQADARRRLHMVNATEGKN